MERMSKTLREKFEAINILFNNRIDRLYLTELVLETPTLKKFEVKTLKDNSQEKSELAKKMNNLYKGKELHEIDHTKFKEYSERLEMLSKEFETSAEIECKLTPENIKVIINFSEEKVVFTFKESEYMDTLIEYLDKSLGQKLLMER